MSNNPLHTSFMQRIFASKQNKPALESIRPAKASLQAVEIKRYISLRIYAVEQAQTGMPSIPVQVLEAGHRYGIVLQCSATRMDDQQREVIISGPFKLRLNHSEINGGICPFAIPQSERTFETPFTDPVKILFALPSDNCPSCHVTFSIKFIEGNNSDGPVIDERTFFVQGDCPLEDAQWLEARYINVGVPKNTIVLSAEHTNTLSSEQGNTSSKICQVAAWNYYNGSFCENIDTSTLINVAESMKSRGSPVVILRRLKAFSRDIIGNLARWIRQARERVKQQQKEQLCLIIFDLTSLEIPWELLEIDYGQYIGAVAQVARWLPLEEFGRKQSLTIKSDTCKGSVIYYLDQHLEGFAAERSLLQAFEHSEMSSLESFLSRLEVSLQNVGLLYIGSHGDNGQRLYSFFSDDATQSSRSAVSALSLLDLLPISGERPTLFINACESARIIHKKYTHVHSLVKNFLLSCASNYIGTTTNVDDREAPNITNRILELAREDEGVLIVEILRRLRKEAIQRLLAGRHLSYAEREYNSRYVLNTFSYVYYGNPLAHLCLHRAQRAREGA